jgi:hypothetical protein
MQGSSETGELGSTRPRLEGSVGIYNSALLITLLVNCVNPNMKMKVFVTGGSSSNGPTAPRGSAVAVDGQFWNRSLRSTCHWSAAIHRTPICSAIPLQGLQVCREELFYLDVWTSDLARLLITSIGRVAAPHDRFRSVSGTCCRDICRSCHDLVRSLVTCIAGENRQERDTACRSVTAISQLFGLVIVVVISPVVLDKPSEEGTAKQTRPDQSVANGGY